MSLSIEKFLIKRGIAQDRKQANIIMLGIIIICIVIMFFVSREKKHNHFTSEKLTPEEIKLMKLEGNNDFFQDESIPQDKQGRKNL